MRSVKNRIDSIVVFSLRKDSLRQLRDFRLRNVLFIACVIFLRLLRFLRTFYFACVLFLTQCLACVACV